jgi:hypothetical protein
MSSLEPGREGRWRVTYFHLEKDEPELLGHTEYLSRDEAINCLLSVYSARAFSEIRQFM